jgi:hypothetical protein
VHAKAVAKSLYRFGAAQSLLADLGAYSKCAPMSSPTAVFLSRRRHVPLNRAITALRSLPPRRRLPLGEAQASAAALLRVARLTLFVNAGADRREHTPSDVVFLLAAEALASAAQAQRDADMCRVPDAAVVPLRAAGGR